MNKLMFLMVGLLSACGFEPSHRQVYFSELKFKAGDHVTHSGFYQNCSGVVVGYYSYVPREDPNMYSVDFYCGLLARKTVQVEEPTLELTE